MNLINYSLRQLKRLKIDLLIQRTFLAGQVPSIDNRRIIKTVSTNYEELEEIFFKHHRLKPFDVIIDVGCGKGRVFNYLLYKGLKNQMIGYEINPAVAGKTHKRLARFKNIVIRTGNIFDDFPQQANVFYLYNPFKEEMVAEFARRILNMGQQDPVVIYNNPVHLELFNEEKFICEYSDIPVITYGYNFRFAVIRLKPNVI